MCTTRAQLEISKIQCIISVLPLLTVKPVVKAVDTPLYSCTLSHS